MADRRPDPASGGVVDDAREVLIRRVARIGVQTVERDGDRYYVTIKNRTYSSEHEVPVSTARRYYRFLLP